jgi:hypothetical protein
VHLTGGTCESCYISCALYMRLQPRIIDCLSLVSAMHNQSLSLTHINDTQQEAFGDPRETQSGTNSAALRAPEATRALSAQLKAHRAPPPTATAPGAHSVRRVGASDGLTGSGAPAPTSTPPSARRQRRRHTFVASHAQSCSRSHVNTSRCPPSAASAQQFLVYKSPSSSAFHGHPCSRAHCNTPGARPERRSHNAYPSSDGRSCSVPGRHPQLYLCSCGAQESKHAQETNLIGTSYIIISRRC